MKRANLMTGRSGFSWRSNWFCFTKEDYNLLLFRDYLIAKYIANIFFNMQLPSSSVFLKYYITNFIFISCDVYVTKTLSVVASIKYYLHMYLRFIAHIRHIYFFLNATINVLQEVQIIKTVSSFLKWECLPLDCFKVFCTTLACTDVHCPLQNADVLYFNGNRDVDSVEAHRYFFTELLERIAYVDTNAIIINLKKSYIFFLLSVFHTSHTRRYFFRFESIYHSNYIYYVSFFSVVHTYLQYTSMDYSLAIHIISTLPIELYCIAQLYKKATTIYFEESIILEYFECIEKSLTFHVDCFSVNTKTIVGVHCITNLYNCFYIRYITSYISVELKHVLLSKFFLTLTIYLHSTLNHNLTYMSTLLFNKKVVYSYKLNYLTLENTTTLVANIFIKNINNALVFKYFFLNSILFSILFYNTIAHSFRYIHTSTILLSLLFISKKCTSINAYTFIRSTYTNLVTSIFYCKQFVYTTAYKYWIFSICKKIIYFLFYDNLLKTSMRYSVLSNHINTLVNFNRHYATILVCTNAYSKGFRGKKFFILQNTLSMHTSYYMNISFLKEMLVFFFFDTLTYKIEASIYNFIQSSAVVIFTPYYYYLYKPYLTSAKLIAEFLYFKITKTKKIGYGYNCIKRWQILERSFIDFGFRLKPIHYKTFFLANQLEYYLNKKKKSITFFKETAKALPSAMFAASSGRSHLGGLRIVCVGPPYKGKRTISSHYHLWISKHSITGDMPLQTTTGYIEYFQTHFTFKQATFGLKVWLMFRKSKL